jgi:hypothetical protein
MHWDSLFDSPLIANHIATSDAVGLSRNRWLNGTYYVTFRTAQRGRSHFRIGDARPKPGVWDFFLFFQERGKELMTNISEKETPLSYRSEFKFILKVLPFVSFQLSYSSPRCRERGRRLTQSEGVTHMSLTLSIFARTQAPFQTKDRGSTSFGGGIIWTFSIFLTSGVAIAWSLFRSQW